MDVNDYVCDLQVDNIDDGGCQTEVAPPPPLLLTPVSDGEVFIVDDDGPADDVLQKRKDVEEVDSFFGSDKEVDEAVEFSHTDSSSSSSSTNGSEASESEEVEALERTNFVSSSQLNYLYISIYMNYVFIKLNSYRIQVSGKRKR